MIDVRPGAPNVKDDWNDKCPTRLLRGPEVPWHHRAMNWNADTIATFREGLGLSQSDFASLLGVDARSVRRWEAGHGTPTGAALAVLNGLHQAVEVERRKGNLDELIRVVVTAAAVGGLAFLLYKLLTFRVEEDGDA